MVWPRVHVPTCSVAMFDFDSLPDATSDAGPAGARRFGVYAVSDIHTDKRRGLKCMKMSMSKMFGVLIRSMTLYFRHVTPEPCLLHLNSRT